jgi:molybdate transport system ATP-binding protein
MSAAADGTPSIDARFDGQLGDFHLQAAFTVPARGITAVLGPSGCGKTSLLRCIAGLSRLPGRFSLGDQVWQDERRFLKPHQRSVGYVFQEPSLLANLSVRGNLVFGLRRSKATLTIAFDEVVSLLGVGHLLDRSTARLSGGERQRVAIGRALLSQPELLLMDEPLSSLDAESKDEILPYLERLHQTLSIPMIYVSHDLAEVARLADRVLLMRAGRITLAGVDGAEAGRISEAEARRTLGQLDDDQRSRLALAALMVGLPPIDAPNGDA